ncbi:hypothetical protein [Streptomyces sp. URMC 123]|uniref:hypothetical protein n=1 Tax=Streptomyces sp. URMC 123 TaxID=3423403 RepID=UPI003F1A6BA2
MTSGEPGTAGTTDNSISGGTFHGAVIMARDAHVHHPPPRRHLPRMAVPTVRHYVNNDELFARMDAVWAGCRAEGVPARMLLTGVPGVGATAAVRRWLRLRRDDLGAAAHLHAVLGRDRAGRPADPVAVLQDWLNILGVPREDRPADPDALAAFFRSWTSDGPIVVVIDSAVTAAQVVPLLPGSDDSVVLITSHGRLPALVSRFDVEVLPVRPLDDRHSDELLCRVGRLADDTRGARRPLVRVCGGIPLAVRIIGSHLAALGPGALAELAARFGDRSHRLEAMSVADDLGEPSLPDMLDVVYRGLRADEARTYRLLGLLPTPSVDTEAARALLGAADSAAASAALRALAAANLLERVGGDREPGHAGPGEPGAEGSADGPGDSRGVGPEDSSGAGPGEPRGAGPEGSRGAGPVADGADRFTMSPLVHDHAWRCARSDEPEESREAALDRLVAHHVDRAERAEAALSGRWRYDPEGTYRAYATAPTPPDPASATRLLAERRADLLATVELAAGSGRHRAAWRICQALWTHCLRGGHHADWIAALTTGLSSALECGDLLAVARMHYELGFARLDRFGSAEDDAGHARRHLGEALRLCEPPDGRRTEGHRRTASSALEGLGLLELRQGRPEAALDHFARALAALDGVDHPRGRALLAYHRGRALTALGHHDDADSAFLGARRQFTELPDRYNEARTLIRHAEDRRAYGDGRRALELLDEAVPLMRAHGPAHRQAEALLARGDVLAELGSRDRAVRDWTAARDLYAAERSVRVADAERRLTGAPGGPDGALRPDAASGANAPAAADASGATDASAGADTSGGADASAGADASGGADAPAGASGSDGPAGSSGAAGSGTAHGSGGVDGQ